MLVILLIAAFSAGSVFTASDMANATNSGNGNGWAKLLARVTALENLLHGTSIKVVTLHDDDAGQALGWNPEDIQQTFFITDLDVKPTSRILPNLLHSPSQGSPHEVDCFTDTFEGKFAYECFNTSPEDGDTLVYTVINPQ